MPKKTESTGTGLESYVAKLMGNGSNRTSVTEDEIQVALKDIDVSDEQLTAVYSALRNSGIQIISASGNDDAPMDVDDDDNDTDTDDFDDDDEHDSGRSTITSSRWPSGRRRDGFFQEQEEAHRAARPVHAPACVASSLHGS